MVYHIFIDNSISDFQIQEELNFLREIIHEEKFYKDFYKETLFSNPLKTSLMYEEAHNCVIIPDPTKPCWSAPKTAKGIEDYLKVNLYGELRSIQIHKLDLCEINKAVKDLIEEHSNNNIECIHNKITIATNDPRYDAYLDHPEVAFIKAADQPPRNLLRKAISNTITTLFGDVFMEKDPVTLSIKKRVYFKYLLGSTF